MLAIIASATAAFGLVAFLAMLPDVKRYMKMRSM